MDSATHSGVPDLRGMVRKGPRSVVRRGSEVPPGDPERPARQVGATGDWLTAMFWIFCRAIRIAGYVVIYTVAYTGWLLGLLTLMRVAKGR
jgi:hypothetical protein